MTNRVGNAIQQNVKIPFHRMLAYASTDAAGNLLYTTVTTFILYYYTDVFGLSVAAAGTILLAARILDAFDAPVWGFIIDHTHTRWGQSRPYFLWMAFPFAILFVLMFWSPQLSTTGKFWWAMITYLLFGISYTGMSTPITSILPNLSNDSDERIKMNSTRMIGGNIGYFVTATFTLGIAAFLGKDNALLVGGTQLLFLLLSALHYSYLPFSIPRKSTQIGKRHCQSRILSRQLKATGHGSSWSSSLSFTGWGMLHGPRLSSTMPNTTWALRTSPRS